MLRDVDLRLPPATRVAVRRIRWLDPQRNSYFIDARFDAQVVRTDPYKIELSPDFVTTGPEDAFFSPMSDVSYRVILPRLERERVLFRMLNAGLLVLLVLAAAAAVVDSRRVLQGRASRREGVHTSSGG